MAETTDTNGDHGAVLRKLDKIQRTLESLAVRPERSDPERVVTKQALRREQGLTHLYRDPRTGIYLWRRSDETTGRRITRSTKTRDEAIADP
jgi:hypothetical protein